MKKMEILTHVNARRKTKSCILRYITNSIKKKEGNKETRKSEGKKEENAISQMKTGENSNFPNGNFPNNVSAISSNFQIEVTVLKSTRFLLFKL